MFNDKLSLCIKVVTITLILIYCCFKSIESTSSCFDESECENNDIENYKLVQCFGYKGCYGADISGSAMCYCNGFYGCYDATISTSYHISCDGEYGCYDSTLQNSGSSGTTCSGKDSCTLSSITSNSYVECNGLNSCSYSSSITTTNNGDLSCYGYQSCTGITSAIIDGEIKCYGYYGCTNINSLISTSSSIECKGRNSCELSKIEGTNNYLNCEARQSCSETTITGVSEITGEGRQSLERSHITTTNSDLIVTLSGPWSGILLNILCKDGYNCHINCEEWTACQYTNIHCYDGSLCTYTCLADCSTQNYWCPTIYNYQNLDKDSINKYELFINNKEIIQDNYRKELSNIRKNNVNVFKNNNDNDEIIDIRDKEQNDNLIIESIENARVQYRKEMKKLYKSIGEEYDTDSIIDNYNMLRNEKLSSDTNEFGVNAGVNKHSSKFNNKHNGNINYAQIYQTSVWVVMIILLMIFGCYVCAGSICNCNERFGKDIQYTEHQSLL